MKLLRETIRRLILEDTKIYDTILQMIGSNNLEQVRNGVELGDSAGLFTIGRKRQMKYQYWFALDDVDRGFFDYIVSLKSQSSPLTRNISPGDPKYLDPVMDVYVPSTR